MIFITRREHFNAAHKLYNPSWSEEKNEEVFGACANHNWHGHNFELYVTVKGEPLEETGFVMDMKRLGELTKELVIDKIDHKNLNEDVDFMKGKLASCENLVVEIWKILAPAISKESENNAQLHSLRLHETRNNYIEYFG